MFDRAPLLVLAADGRPPLRRCPQAGHSVLRRAEHGSDVLDVGPLGVLLVGELLAVEVGEHVERLLAATGIGQVGRQTKEHSGRALAVGDGQLQQGDAVVEPIAVEQFDAGLAQGGRRLTL